MRGRAQAKLGWVPTPRLARAHHRHRLGLASKTLRRDTQHTTQREPPTDGARFDASRRQEGTARRDRPRRRSASRQVLLRRRGEVLRQRRDLRPFGPARTAASSPSARWPRAISRMMAEAGINTIRVFTAAADLAARHGRRSGLQACWSACRGRSTSPSSTAPRSSAISCAPCVETVRGDEPPSARSSPISSATRSRPTWCAGTGRTACAPSSSGSSAWSRTSIPSGSSATPIFRRPNISPIDFTDFLCFNVYLHQEPPFRSYLSRLHNLAVDRPLVLTEFGIDSMREGDDEQARILSWQVAHRLRDGRRRHLRLRLDRRMVHRRPSDRGLGVRPGRSRPQAEARLRRGARALSADRCRRRCRARRASRSWSAPTTPSARWTPCLASLEKLNYPDYEVDRRQ